MPATLVRRAMVATEARLELGSEKAGFRGFSRLLMDRCELQTRREIRITYVCTPVEQNGVTLLSVESKRLVE